MSHTVTIKTEVRDPAALAAACRRLGLAAPSKGWRTLYRTDVEGWIVALPGWTYPAVFNVETGEARTDTYGGEWGNEAELHKLLQAYAVEKITADAVSRGMSVTEAALPDGTVELLLQEF
jgi:hypothetical protein